MGDGWIRPPHRFLDDVVADLRARGCTSTPGEIGRALRPGFSARSTHSLWVGHLDPTAAQDDERAVREGVSVVPYRGFSGE
ncbi:hypothetical protein ABZ826_09305 [Streptomyces sp. NPDC047515]|uniref:hypothetical protein n=1 Tax=Streptomyces sp. NPDC047515 TaxID=3155380 RepID=UPI0033CE84D0